MIKANQSVLNIAANFFLTKSVLQGCGWLFSKRKDFWFSIATLLSGDRGD